MMKLLSTDAAHTSSWGSSFPMSAGGVVASNLSHAFYSWFQTAPYPPVQTVADVTGSPRPDDTSVYAFGKSIVLTMVQRDQQENVLRWWWSSPTFTTPQEFLVPPTQDATPEVHLPCDASARDEVARALTALKTLVSHIGARRVLQVSPSLRTLAAAALAALPQTRAEDLDTWAERLADDVYDADD